MAWRLIGFPCFAILAFVPVEMGPCSHAFTLDPFWRTPMTVSASTSGWWNDGGSWSLTLNSDGQAELSIDKGERSVRRWFRVTQRQIEVLRKALRDESFFDLNEQQGGYVFSSSVTKLKITEGMRENSVMILHFGHDNSASELAQGCRAIRVLLLIRNWFDDPEAADLREYYRSTLRYETIGGQLNRIIINLANWALE